MHCYILHNIVLLLQFTITALLVHYTVTAMLVDYTVTTILLPMSNPIANHRGLQLHEVTPEMSVVDEHCN